MNLESFLVKVPLLLSYPSILLSSTLILPHQFHQDKIRFATYFTTYLIIPLFAASLLTSIVFFLCKFQQKNVTNDGSRANILWQRCGLVMSFVFFLASTVLGPVQATCLSAIVIASFFHRLGLVDDDLTNSNMEVSWTFLLGGLGPLCVISLLLAHLDGKTRSLGLVALVYLIALLGLKIGAPMFSSYLFDEIHSVNYEHTDDNEEKLSKIRGSKMLSLHHLCLLLCLCYLAFSDFSTTNFNIQFSMLFVFVGCICVFCLSFYELLITECVQDRCISVNGVSRYSILCIGLMSMVLQFLSFSSIAESNTFISDCLVVSYVIGTEIISRIKGIYEYTYDISQIIIQVETDPVTRRRSRSRVVSRVVSHSHTHTQDHSHSHAHSNNDTNGSIWAQMANDEDTRSMFSFLLLNTTFMFIQLLYSFRSKSLGLLSDSLHMALDCTSLLLGLLAGVLAKRPPNARYPFGLGYLETLTGFTNGVLLLGIVCGILTEALGRLFNPVHLEATSELLVVAILGLFVNLIGLFASGGHDHGSDSSNQNKRGVFLHILADTLGSVGVIISTILIKLTHIHLFDPLASIFIGILILVSSMPLLKSTVSSILLKLGDKNHNLIKKALNQISSTPGITGYTTPRFWPPTSNAPAHSHSHVGGASHSHDHAHSHDYDHSHNDEHHKSNDKIHVHKRRGDGAVHDNDIHIDVPVEKKKYALVGYIHVQYAEGENSTIIKKRVEKIFDSLNINSWIQVESNNSTCWCRAKSMPRQVSVNDIRKI
ncbi:hypothetical protein TBLA_0H03280 [Henningerozyma blattae CBS 6284]|uniref:Zinc transporter n=1 Tax=Henningerozyma blattae (strain ATCC 34711 / CBS 6284 / DSM 70876 / NBRC 10599 / NRRL Y-10934 / UCD 77-7) TaxID=1071380 RepID=I2H8A7_HENB6|nr:hypothetical protein TBLA_0H03280 [Tetrapisispora blattae CBS 6284]CCH62609.1 hypothetical protein TBLA_0H03280 [Tetrapisispora blattae CBS 6284]